MILILPGGGGGAGGGTMDTAGKPPPAGPAEIAYHTSAGRVAAMAADGSGKRELGVGSKPSWSPDGTRLAYQKPVLWPGDKRHASSCIYVMNADGTGVTAVTSPAKNAAEQWSWDEYPCWSPDGTQLCFVSRPPRSLRLDVAKPR